MAAYGKMVKALILTAVAILGLCSAVASAAEAPAPAIEGFEDLSGIKPAGRDVKPVTAGQGVTQGRQAIQVPPGASVSFEIEPDKLASAAWLKIDTFCAEGATGSVGIEFTGTLGRYWDVAHVRSGKDTIALPLPTPLRCAPVAKPARPRPGQPAEKLEIALRLINRGEANVILDNVRAERPDKPPPGAILLDFGPPSQIVWPGFHAGLPGDVNVVWSGGTGKVASAAPSAYSPGYPDALTGDFIGPSPYYNRRDSFEVTMPGNEPAVMWLWVTHYAAGYTQPAQCGVRINSRVVMQKRLGAAVLGPQGILEGKDGEWTPEWFNDVHAPRLVEAVRVALPAGKAEVELADCQVAAVAIAPGKQQVALDAYCRKVNDELAVYRKQFVVGRRRSAICPLEPTADEQKANVMVFQPRHGLDFSVADATDKSRRTDAIRMEAAAGIRTMVSVTVAALEETPYMTASLTGFRTKEGRPLAVAPGGAEVFFLEKVPRVFEGAVELQPWILTRRTDSLKAKETAFLLIAVEPHDGAPAGVYHADLHLTFTGGPARVPVTMEVTNMGRPPRGKQLAPAMAAMTRADAEDIFRAYAMTMPAPQRGSISMRIRRDLMNDALDGLIITGPTITSELVPNPNAFLQDLRFYPGAQARGPTLLDITHIAWGLAHHQKARPGTKPYRAAVTNIVNNTTAAVERTIQGDYYFYLGDLSRGSTTERMASEVRAVGGKTIARVPSGALGSQQGQSGYRAFSALIISPGSRTLPSQIAAFKKLGKERKAFLQLAYPDRYAMGFFAAGVGADGCFLEDVFMKNGGPYSGFWIAGRALIVPQLSARTAETLGMVHVRQGRDDFLLMARAEDLFAQAKAAKVQASKLEGILSEIKLTVMTHAGLHYDSRLLRTTDVELQKLESWRTSLMKACADVAKALEETKLPPLPAKGGM